MVAIEDGRVVGTCRLVFRGDVARLGRMAVERDLRGRGLGAAILREAERAAADAGLAGSRSTRSSPPGRSTTATATIERGPVFEEEESTTWHGEAPCLSCAWTRSPGCG